MRLIYLEELEVCKGVRKVRLASTQIEKTAKKYKSRIVVFVNVKLFI